MFQKLKPDIYSLYTYTLVFLFLNWATAFFSQLYIMIKVLEQATAELRLSSESSWLAIKAFENKVNSLHASIAEQTLRLPHESSEPAQNPINYNFDQEALKYIFYLICLILFCYAGYGVYYYVSKPLIVSLYGLLNTQINSFLSANAVEESFKYTDEFTGYVIKVIITRNDTCEVLFKAPEGLNFMQLEQLITTPNNLTASNFIDTAPVLIEEAVALANTLVL